MSNNWNGKGLPPLGELLSGGKVFGSDGIREWFEFPRFRVVGHHYKENWFFVETLNPEGKNIGMSYFEVGSEQYRPIKSDRDKAIEEMLAYMQSGWTKDIAAELYDAGYRKQSGE